MQDDMLSFTIYMLPLSLDFTLSYSLGGSWQPRSSFAHVSLMPVMSAVCPTVCSDVQSCLPFPEFRQPARLRLTITKGRMRTLSSKPSGAYVGVLHACSGATASFAGLPARVQYPLSQNISATFSLGTPARATRCCALIRHTADLCTSEPILHPQM